jgi:hypothetical protein
VKNRFVYRILVFVGCLLVVAGITPGAYVLVRLGGSPPPTPLSFPVTLKQGTITSPEFTPAFSSTSLIELDWNGFPARQTGVDLDWKIIADNGSTLQQGSLATILRGANTVTLGEYQPTPGQGQKVVLNVHSDTEGAGVNAILKVGSPEQSFALSSDIPRVAAWAVWLAGPGFLLLIVLLFVKYVGERKGSR